MYLTATANKILALRLCLVTLLWLGLQLNALAQITTSWTGNGTDWNTAGNWTAGVPDATKHAVIGDANFTGNKEPKIDQTSLAECLSLTIGGAKAVKLLVSSDKGLTVHGDVLIVPGSEMENEGTYITVKGNWTNNGIFTENLYIKGNSPNARSTQYPKVEFTGTGKTIGGTGANTFNHLILTGATILSAPLNMVARTNTSGNVTVQPELYVKGSLDPGTHLVWVPSVTGVVFDLAASATLFVKGPTYSSNYSRFPSVYWTASTINYAGGNQLIDNALVYPILRVSGSGVKKLSGNTRVYGATDSGLHIDAGTLDLETYTLDKDSSPGAYLSIASGATLRIGGTNTFPANYGTNTLHANSTVEYYGTNQTVALQTYGHLLLSTSGVKTMPVTAMTVQGNLTSTGTVSYTAGASVNVAGNVTIGTGTTFNGGSATHTIGGNWAANGTFTGNASTVLMTGNSKTISSTAGATEFYNLTLNGTGINVTVPALTIRGDLNAPGGISQVADGTITFTNTVSKSISGNNLNFQNLTVDGIVTTAANPTLYGNFTVNTGKTFTASAGTVTMAGASKNIAGSGTKTFFNLNIANLTSTANSLTVNASLSGASSLTASAGTATFGNTSTYAGTHYLYNVGITGSSMRMLANANLYVAGAFTKGVSSAFDVTTSTPNTVYYNGTSAQAILATPYHHLVLTNTGAKTAGGVVTVNGNILLDAGSILNAGNFNHMMYGNWTNNGTFNHDNGTVTFTGAANASITGATIFNALTINKTAVTNAVTLNNDATATTLNMTNGELRTGANKVIILGDRTGSGWVVGTVTRQHAFAPGSAYAFNGPYATIAFSGGTGVTEATMITGIAMPAGIQTGRSINRLYEITTPAGNYTTASVQLQYQDSELNSCVEAALKLYWRATTLNNWTSSSRHANDATQNWVRRNNLTTVAGQWTITDNPSNYKWDGAKSTAWEDGQNWEVWTDGNMSRGIMGPTIVDIVELGGLVPARQPSISFAEWVKEIKFLGTSQIALKVAAGSLATDSHLAALGAGTGVIHTLDAGAQPVIVGGNLVLNDGSIGNSLSLLSSTGTVTVTGNLQHQQNGNITLGSSNLNIGGNYNYTAGTFTGGTSTVTYNGTGAQVVAGVPYHHLTVNKSAGIATLASAAAQSITGNLTVTGGTMALNVPTINVAGNVTLTAGTLQGNTSTIDLKGNWLRTSGTYTPGTSTVTFSGTNPQTVDGTTFHNLSKTTINTLTTTTGNSSLTGNLDVQSGMLVLNNHTMDRTTAGGALTLADGATLRINTVNYPVNYSTNTLGTNSTVIYSGGNTGVAGVTYGNLILQDAATRSLLNNTRVANLMTIANGATLSNQGAVYTLTLDTDLTNNGTINALNTDLIFTSATARLNGTGTGATTVRNLTINSGGGLTVSKNLTLHGSLTNSGNGFTSAANWVDFTGTTAASITSAVPLTINELRVNKTGTTPTVLLAGDINGLQTINVATGTLDAANRTLTKKATPGTTLTIANAATMKIGFTNSLPLFDSYSLQPASTVVYNGSSQTIKSVQYGHLDLQNIGTVTFEAGIAQVAGNMTKGTEATVVTPETIEFNGAVAQNMPGIDYKNLLISANGNKILNGNATIANSLTFAPALTGAMLLATGREITLSGTATLTGEQETSHVIGTIKTTRDVPANSITNFGGIGIEINPGVPAGLSTMTRVTGQAIGQDGNSIQRYYRFQPAQNAGNLNASINASYFISELDKDGIGADHEENNLVLYGARFLGDGYTALSDLTNLNTTTKSIAVSGINSINYLTFSSPIIKPLPVELLYFKATKQDNAAVLEWKTASEKNNSGFEIEASADGYSYQKIGFVKSAVGTSAIAQNYTFADNRNGKNGVLYYRLRQVDEDGTFKFYGPRTVNFGTVTKTAIVAYPNPFESEVKLAIDAANDGKARLILYTAAGKIITQHEEPLAKGASVLQLNLNQNLPRGLYLLTIEQNGEVETLKLIKN